MNSLSLMEHEKPLLLVHRIPILSLCLSCVLTHSVLLCTALYLVFTRTDNSGLGLVLSFT